MSKDIKCRFTGSIARTLLKFGISHKIIYCCKNHGMFTKHHVTVMMVVMETNERAVHKHQQQTIIGEKRALTEILDFPAYGT